jgi:hypothetical protein
MTARRLFLILLPMLLSACGTVPRSGGYYEDDGPDATPPADIAGIPDAVPKTEPRSLSGNKPYVVFGVTYTPLAETGDYRERGIASWYGKKFHGKRTSSGEPYDMYAMTAAHKTLPLPSYVRVRNLQNNRSVLVRVNDRGPFLHGRRQTRHPRHRHRRGGNRGRQPRRTFDASGQNLSAPDHRARRGRREITRIAGTGGESQAVSPARRLLAASQRR